jgi:peptidyl-prolyl cis-trans isomerase D
LQEEGVFSSDLYHRLLAQQGTNSGQFEADTRKRLLTAQLIQGVSDTAFITQQEIKDAYKLQQQKRDFDYLTISHMALFGEAEVSHEEAEKYFNENPDKFEDPEKVKLAFLTLLKSDLAEGIEIDPEDLQTYYEEKKQGLVKQEQRRARHILIQHDADADEAAIETAESIAEELLNKIDDGADFAELAKGHSDDPGSAEQGGDLGFFARGAMVPEFDEEVFSMKTGDTSDLVHSQFGFHIIRLEEIEASQIPTFDEAKADLEKEMKLSEAEDIFYTQLEQLTDLAFENPDSLQPAADELGLTIEQSDWVWKNNPVGLGKYPKLIAAAYSEDVLDAGNNSEPIEVSPDEVIVVRVTERKAAELKKFDDVVGTIQANLKVKKASELAKEQGEALLEKVHAGSELKEFEKEEAYSFAEAKEVTRILQSYNPYLLKKVFQLRAADDELPMTEGFHLVDGDYVIVKMKAVHEAEVDKLTKEESLQLRRGLENMYKSATLAAIVEDLRDHAVIEIPEDSE